MLRMQLLTTSATGGGLTGPRRQVAYGGRQAAGGRRRPAEWCGVEWITVRGEDGRPTGGLMRKALGRELVLVRRRQERKKQRQEQSGRRRKRIEPGTCGYLTYTRCCRALPRPTMKAGGKQNRTYLVCVDWHCHFCCHFQFGLWQSRSINR